MHVPSVLYYHDMNIGIMIVNYQYTPCIHMYRYIMHIHTPVVMLVTIRMHKTPTIFSSTVGGPAYIATPTEI